MAPETIEPTNLEAYENKRDDLFAGLQEAYEAGYKKALEDLENTDEPPTAEQIAGSDYIGECHYYYWDGRTLPLDPWLRAQFDIDS